MSSSAARTSALTRFRLPNLLDWLVRQDARHRQAHRMNSLSDHVLRDIGLTKEELLRGWRSR